MVEEVFHDGETTAEVLLDQALELVFLKHVIVPMIDCRLLLLISLGRLYKT